MTTYRTFKRSCRNWKEQRGYMYDIHLECFRDLEGISMSAREVCTALSERDSLRAENQRLREALSGADPLRPVLLKQLGYVPECVLWFCNQARAALSRKETE